MASSGGRPVWQDPRTGRTFHYDPQTNEVVYSDGSRVSASSQFNQPAPNVPRTGTGAVRQLSASTFSPQPYNQQYTSSPPVAAGASVQKVTRQLQNVGIAQPAAATTSTLPSAAGRAIDGAEVVRNPPIRGSRRYPFEPKVQNRLLDRDFKLRDQPVRYFVPGKVFLTLWTEPASAASAATSNNDCFAVAYGQRAFCRVRRFVVVRSGTQSCTAIAVSTHSGRGSPPANKSEHGVIFTGKTAPDIRNEPGMQPKAIKVNPDDKGAYLDSQSRINYGKVYTIEHNVKVKNFGSLSPEYLNALFEQFTAVFTSKIRGPTGPAPASSDRENKPAMTGNDPKDTRQFQDATRQDAVARHTRNAAAGGRAPGSNNPTNPSGGREQQPTREPEESDEDDDDDNEVEDEGSDEDDDEDEDEEDDDDDDDDEDEDDEDDDDDKQ